MATEETDKEVPTVMEYLLEKIRKQYVDEYDEEPPEEFMEEARKKLVERAAKQDRDKHREIYAELAKE